MAENKDGSTPQEPFTDLLKQIHFESSDELAKKETGKKIAKRLYNDQMGQTTSLNFFSARAAHWAELEKWSLGKQDMAQFLPFMNIVDGNKAHAKIDMTPIMIGAQFVGTKIQSIANTDEYPCVKAVDEGSVDEKADRMFEALWRMKEVKNIAAMQQALGAPLEPTDAYVPDDELSAKVYFELEDRLPKEIKFEGKLKDTLDSNDYQRVLKPKLLRDNIVYNFEATKIEKISRGKYTLRDCVPKNCFYNFFLRDTGKNELSYFGEAYNLKVKDIRSKYGKTADRPEGLTEEDIYNFAKKSAQNYPANPVGFNHQFGQQYSLFNNNTPWDDYSGYVIDFEIEVSESDYFVTKIDSYGKENISPKKGIPKPTSDKATIQKKNKKRWYRGVYAPYADMMVYWGKPDLTILNYTDTESSFCSYSVNIPSNNGEYAPSLFERAMEPLKEYALAKLKRKLLLSKLSPAQYRVNIEGARDLMDGTGKVYDWEEIVRIKDQTGVELYSSAGLDPLTQGAPTFSAATQDPTLGNIAQLSDLLNNIAAEIRVLLGVPIYLDGSDVGQRTAAKLAEGQSEGSFNVTGFVPNGHNQLMEETLNKVCILCWQDIVTDKAESSSDLINTRFKTTVKMKSTAAEKQQLEDDIQRYSQVPDKNGNPSLTLKDAMFIREIDDLKLSRWYLTSMYEENRRKAIADSDRNVQKTAEAQQASNQQTAENEAAAQKQKVSDEKDMKMFESTQAKELAFVNGWMQAVGKGVIDPSTVMPIIQQMMPNIIIPVTMENKHLSQVSQNLDMAQQQQAQQQQQEQQEGEQGNPDAGQEQGEQQMQQQQQQSQPTMQQ